MERHDPGDPESISAYAKLEFEQFSFFIQTLTLVVGRKARREDNVDVHLGVSKSISRIHAKIFYQFDAMSWEIEVLGKNGAFINERYVQAGSKSVLKSTDKLLIGDANFVFLLPDGAAPPQDPTHSNSYQTGTRAVSTPTSVRPTGSIKMQNDSRNVIDHAFATPVAPHHLMAKPVATKLDESLKPPISPLTNGAAPMALNSNKVVPPVAAPRAYLTTPQNQADYSSATPITTQKLPNSGNVILSQANLDNHAKIHTPIKVEATQPSADNPVWASKAATAPTDRLSAVPTNLVTSESTEMQAKTEEERRLQDEEAAAQHAAQLLHQERLARQAREEEEGLILPPAETDPAVIAALQKPSASYATMIYNAIASHEKKKMTLAQIYSWICINHPYYRYIQNGWQNSIRHNLSLNKAFMKVPRTDDEPGKGSFWAVDPESEMLFEGGVYKKKPPRPVPSAPINRGAPVVMKDGKLALNPNFFVGGIQGKAEEVLQTLQAAVQKQLGYGNEPEQASQLARILALALATQLRQAAVAATTPRQHQGQLMHRPAPAQSSLPRYPATPSPSVYRSPMTNQMLRPPQPVGFPNVQPTSVLTGTSQVSSSTGTAVVPKHPYMTSPYAINANSSLTSNSLQKGPYSSNLKVTGLPISALSPTHSNLPATTNTVYYKPYQATNGTTSTSQGISTTTAPVKPTISATGTQANKSVTVPQTSGYASGTKAVPPGGTGPATGPLPMMSGANDIDKNTNVANVATSHKTGGTSAASHNSNDAQHALLQPKVSSVQAVQTGAKAPGVSPATSQLPASGLSVQLASTVTTSPVTSRLPPPVQSNDKNPALVMAAVGSHPRVVEEAGKISGKSEDSLQISIPQSNASLSAVDGDNLSTAPSGSSTVTQVPIKPIDLQSNQNPVLEKTQPSLLRSTSVPSARDLSQNISLTVKDNNETAAQSSNSPHSGPSLVSDLAPTATEQPTKAGVATSPSRPGLVVGSNGNNKRPIELDAEMSASKMQKSSEPAKSVTTMTTTGSDT